MSGEVFLNSIDELDKYCGVHSDLSLLNGSVDHKIIYSLRCDSFRCLKVTGLSNQSFSTIKTGEKSRSILNEIQPMKASAEVKIDVTWGDNQDPKISVGASGEVSDNNGNYAKIEITRDNEGNSEASASVGLKADDD